MEAICSNEKELVNYLIIIFYCEYASSNKDILWNVYGNVIFENVKERCDTKVLFPVPSTNGDIVYLNKRFELKEVEF